ncbi:hypothetical protein [Streptosporangium fragile]
MESPHAPDVQGSLPLTGDQADALAAGIARAFPAWRIWQAGGIWYAAGPCPRPGCRCARTLHAPGPGGLYRQLDDAEQRTHARREALL